MFGRNGRDAETLRLHRAATAMSGVAIPGRSLTTTNACLHCDPLNGLSHYVRLSSCLSIRPSQLSQSSELSHLKT